MSASFVYNVQPKPQFTRKRQFKTFFHPPTGTGPWSNPVAFPRDLGWITIGVKHVESNFKFSFEVAGGMGSQPNDPRSNYYNIQGTEEECFFRLDLVTNDNMIAVEDLLGRIWYFQFYPYRSVPPTIFLQSGTISTSDTIEVAVTDHIPF
jgi:hypothetical protein